MYLKIGLPSITATVLGLLGASSPAAADWSAEGVLLSSACCSRGAHVVSDGVGGAVVVWQDTRTGGEDVYAQRVTASGEIAPGWGPEGIGVCTDPAPQLLTAATADGQGGVVVTWYDHRSGGDPAGTRTDIYAQRILADGTVAPGWPVNGAPVTRAPGDQVFSVVAADGLGGAYFSWQDDATEDIYLQHLGSGGQVVSGWPVDGLPVCTLPGFQGYPIVIADGSGGVIITWGDLRDGPLAAYGQRVLADGSLAPGWPQDGMRIVLDRAMRGLIPDGAGGAYLSCATLGDIQDSGYYLQRFTGEGAIAPGWPEGGALVASPAEFSRAGIRMVPDGAGGVLLAWYDYRDTFDDEIFLQRVRGDGTLQPGWPVDGLRVTDNLEFDSGPELAPDGQGGAYLGWDRGACNECQAMVQHVTGAATLAPGWPAAGQAVPGAPRTGEPALVADDRGGAIVVWEDASGRLRALRLAPDGPTPALLALVSVEAAWDRVVLVWHGAETGGISVGVERRTEATDWTRLGPVGADGTGTLRFEDRDVRPGTRYGYRLAYRAGGEDQHTAEAWVEVPSLAFALHGAQPNPAAVDLVVGFSLPSADPAFLELYDLAGRQVLAHAVGARGPGRHRVDLTQRARLPAGVYTLVLTQGEHRATTRAVLLR